MGFVLPGQKFVRYGDNLLNSQGTNEISKIPAVKIGRMNSLTRTSDSIARVKTASADISRTAPTFNDPRYTFTTLSIPTDQRTLNGLYRFFDDTDPVVGNAIRLHAEFPLSRISLTDCGDSVIQRHFEDMWNRLNFDKLLFDIAVEYWRIGNVFPFGAWNTDDYMWDQFVILNPDYVTVESTYLNQKPFVKLQPDEHLKRIVSSGQPRELYNQLPPQLIKYIRLGQEIPLSPNNVFHLAHNKAPYETLGRSIIKRILKTLVYEDRMSQANFAIATRQVIPITVVKLGDPQSGWVPEEDEIEDVREMLASREVDPNFSLIYHWGINIEFYGASGKIWNLANEFQRTMKWKLMGLGISEAILSGGANYASAYAQLEVLRQRYLHFQMMLERFIHRGLFEPVAKLCGFYKTDKLVSGASYTGKSYGQPNENLNKLLAESTVSDNPEFRNFVKNSFDSPMGQSVSYIYPALNWDLMSLNNDVQYKNFLMNFDKMFPGERKVSDTTFYKVAQLDKDAEQKKLEKEYREKLQQSLDRAKVDKEYLKKFIDGGLTPPPQLVQDATGPGMGMPGEMGATPSDIPGMPSPEGGGVGAGGQVETPSAPMGQPSFQGTKAPGSPSIPGGPAQARQESLQIQRQMTSSTLEEQLKKEGQTIEKENAIEAETLKKQNESLLKSRARERGDPNET